MERDLEKEIREVLPPEHKDCKIVYTVSCNCFQLVKSEAVVDSIFSTLLALTLLALWGYSAYWVFTAEEVSTLMWVSFWLSLGSLLMMLVVAVNKSAAIHKIEYKRYRNQKPDWFSIY